MIPGSARRDTRLLAVWATGLGAFLNLYAPQSVLPELARLFGASRGYVSLIITASTLGVALAAPFAGLVADALGRRRLILASLAGLGASTVLAATAGSLGVLIAWRFVAGLFLPGAVAGVMAFLGDEWQGGGLGSATASYVTSTVVGGFCGRFLAGLAAEFLGWRWAFLIVGALSLLAARLVAAWLPARPHRPAPIPSLAQMTAPLRDRRLLVACCIGFNVLFSLIGIFTYVTFYLAAPPFSLGPAALGSIFAVYLVGVVVTPLGGRLIDALGYRAALVIAMIWSAAGALLALSHSLEGVLLGLAAVSSGVFVAQAAATGYVTETAGAGRGAAAGAYVAFYYAGGSAGAVVPSLFWSLGGWPACVALVVAMQAITLVLATRFWPKAGRGPLPLVPKMARP